MKIDIANIVFNSCEVFNFAAEVFINNRSHSMWWVCVFWSIFLSLINKSPPSTIILPRVSSILLKSLCEFIPLEAVIWKPSILPEKSLWSRSHTTLSIPRPDDALTDFIANSTLGITKFYIAVNTASCTLVSTGSQRPVRNNILIVFYKIAPNRQVIFQYTICGFHSGPNYVIKHPLYFSIRWILV